MNTQKPTRNLALELVRVTEAAALSAGRFMGRGEKEVADKAAPLNSTFDQHAGQFYQ